MKYQQVYMTSLIGVTETKKKRTINPLFTCLHEILTFDIRHFDCLGDSRRTRTPTMGTGIPRSIQLNYGALTDGKVNIFPQLLFITKRFTWDEPKAQKLKKHSPYAYQKGPEEKRAP